MLIVIGSDHRGFTTKAYLKQYVIGSNDPIAWIDVGAENEERSDYPIFTQKACDEILHGEAVLGVLICGSGIGMSIAANRFSGVFAGLVWNKEVAIQSKEHDNTNVIIIPSDYVSHEQAAGIITAWLDAKFKGGRYQERLAMIDVIKK